jgi:hypothetical protein
LLLLGLLIPAGPFVSCEPEDWILDINCGTDCFSYRPDTADLIVLLSLDAEHDSIPLTFYRGDADGEIDWQDTAIYNPLDPTNEFNLPSRVGQRYTVKATYRSGDRIIEAYDADVMTLQDYGSDCGSPCYVVKGGIFNLQLSH